MSKGDTLTLVIVAVAFAFQGVACSPSTSSETADRTAVKGFFAPVGPPAQPPSRTDAGDACIVDLVQGYELLGTVSGSATIDYRIFIEGPCGAPPGTYPEEWIAHGKLNGRLREREAKGSFTYLAGVKAGGEVSGEIVFGDGLQGELEVTGRFGEGKLSYTGWVR